jgi:ribosomal RNA-processing protein 12
MQRRKDRKKKEQKENPSQKGVQKDDDEDILAGESSGDEEEEEEEDLEVDDKDAFIIENEEPVDLMDVGAIKRVVSTQPRQKKQASSGKTKEKVKFEEQDGKIVVPDDKKAKRKQEMEEMEQELLDGTDAKTKKSRKRSADEDEEVQEPPADDKPQKKPFIVSKTSNKRQKQDQKNKHSGTDFKGKGSGDILKDGKLQPYAYVPLNRKMLNRRYVCTQKGC